jgi:CubicO group peptidase (beta-lactamase class C family)
VALNSSGTSTTWSGTAQVWRGTDLVEEVSAGFAAGPDGAPCSPGLRYQAGSISKLVVSVVVLSLAERGELNVNEPIGRWFDKTPRPWDTITLHQLLSHTSGMGHWGDIPNLPATFLTAPPSRDQLTAMIAETPLVHSPGTMWHYSGPGFLVAAHVVEAATGVDYGEIAAELVFRRAHLRATSSGQFPTGYAGIAFGHRHGDLISVPEGFTELPGTGDVWTTVGDLIVLSQALRTGVVLGDTVAAQLWTPQVTVGRSGAVGPVVNHAYGYGTFLGSVQGRPARIHPGDNPGYQSLLAYLPDADLDCVVLCNEDTPSVSAALNSLTAL